MRTYEDRELKYSQNFLYNSDLVEKLLSLTNISRTDCVIEIGAGKGIITKVLLEYTNIVIAIEKDAKLFDFLKIKFNDYKNIVMINEDFLKYNMSYLKKFKIFSNIPFNITTDIINKIICNENKPVDMYLIMQEDAAKRFIGQPYTNETMKSILLKIFYDTEIIYNFRRTDFSPAPKVDVVLVHFKRNICIEHDIINQFRDFLSFMFMIKGKTIRDKMKTVFSYEQLKRISKKVDLNIIITSLTFENWLYIFEVFRMKVEEKNKINILGYYKKYINSQANLKKVYKSRNN